MEDKQARYDAGVALMESGRVEEARVHFECMLQEFPDNGYLWGTLALTLSITGRVTEAEHAYKNAVTLDPGTPIWREQFALSLLPAGRVEEALELVASFSTLGSDFVRAASFEYTGEVDRAIEGIEEVVTRARDYRPRNANRELPPFHFIDKARITAAKCYYVKKDYGEALAQLAFAADSPDVFLERGKCWEKLGRYDLAWSLYQRANIAHGHRYDPEVFRRQREIEKRMNFKSQSRADGSRLIFIVGIPRSGTSLVEQILGMHPEVTPMGERKDTFPIVREFGSRNWEDPGEDALTQFAEYYLTGHADGRVPSTGRVTDKLPENWRYTKMLRALFPGCKIVHVVRNPEDVLFSCFSQLFSSRALSWTSCVEGLRDYYKEWEKEEVGGYRVQYEELVTTPEKVIPDLLRYLELPPDDACFRPQESKRVVGTASYAQVRNPINVSSVGRGSRFLDFLKPVFA